MFLIQDLVAPHHVLVLVLVLEVSARERGSHWQASLAGVPLPARRPRMSPILDTTAQSRRSSRSSVSTQDAHHAVEHPIGRSPTNQQALKAPCPDAHLSIARTQAHARTTAWSTHRLAMIMAMEPATWQTRGTYKPLRKPHSDPSQ